MREPFLTASEAFLNSHRAYFSENTWRQRHRDLQLICRDLWALQHEGRVQAMRPSTVTEYDVAALVQYWRTRPSRYGTMKPQTIRKYLGILDMFLTWANNPIVRKMGEERKLILPVAEDSPILTLSQDDLARLRQAASAMPGWNGSVARFLVAILPYSGLRRKEIRLARLADLDIARWRVLVHFPKGEGSWATPDDFAPILPPAHQDVLDYLDERRKYMNGREHGALIPLRRWDGALSCWSDGMFGKLKGDLARISGLKFSWKTFRATFCQMHIDMDPRLLSAVSKAMRHKTTKTTEIYYGRVRTDRAFAELENLYATPNVQLSK